MRAIHWFRSDLRVEDNTAMSAISEAAEEVIALFILDDKLLGQPRDHPRVAFMLERLHSLGEQLRKQGSDLVVLRGEPETVLPQLCEQLSVGLVGWNRDYSPYAKSRDHRVRGSLERLGVEVRTFKDRLAFEACEIRKGDGGPFKVFTPYKRKWRNTYQTVSIEPAGSVTPKPLSNLNAIPTVAIETLGFKTSVELPRATANAAKTRLRDFLDGPVRNYKADRDRPDLDGTSRLSPYLRFGILSIRTCLRWAEEAKAENPQIADGVDTWVDELIWREFYHAVLDEFPHVYSGPFKPEYAEIEWDNDPTLFEAWCNGQTGYPIVDAAMRQLNQTGWMHNRSRMVVASFLTKDMLIDWRWGERYFMQRLIDGDPASNNGGWQWAASTGTDAQPYFRIFNPARQGERFDPNGAYVKRWVPELRDVPAKLVHQPRAALDPIPGYPLPVVDHKTQRQIAIDRYKASQARVKRGGRKSGETILNPSK